jgi:hypothetical protein
MPAGSQSPKRGSRVAWGERALDKVTGPLGPRRGIATALRQLREIAQLLDVRARRQEALRSREGLDPLNLVAVTHESSLRQAVGSPEILRDQLDALVERSKAPNVSLHVLPFDAGPIFTMTCMYAYFEYQDTHLEQDVVHIETHAGYWSIEDPDKVAEYRKADDALVKASLSEDASRTRIRSIRDDMRSEL